MMYDLCIKVCRGGYLVTYQAHDATSDEFYDVDMVLPGKEELLAWLMKWVAPELKAVDKK